MPVLERLVILVLVVWGTTNVVSGSKLVKPLRDRLQHFSPALGTLAKCYMCAGFWIAIGWSFLGLGVCNQFRLFELQSFGNVIGVIADGMMGSGTTWILFVVLARLGRWSCRCRL